MECQQPFTAKNPGANPRTFHVTHDPSIKRSHKSQFRDLLTVLPIAAAVGLIILSFIVTVTWKVLVEQRYYCYLNSPLFWMKVKSHSGNPPTVRFTYTFRDLLVVNCTRWVIFNLARSFNLWFCLRRTTRIWTMWEHYTFHWYKWHIY